MKAEIVNCMSWLANRLVETNTFSWGDDYKVKKNSEAYEEFYKELKQHIDFNTLTPEEALELRFRLWDEESKIYLIPLYLVPILPEGLEVFSINGHKKVIGTDYIDNDIRYGCIAYGIKIEK